VRVLLDENLPEGLVEPLRLLGHTVDSVASLRLKGLPARLHPLANSRSLTLGTSRRLRPIAPLTWLTGCP